MNKDNLKYLDNGIFVEDKEEVIKRWDRLELCKGLKGDLDETISKLYEHR